MPLLNNSDGTNWLTDEMAAMLKSPARAQHLAQQAVQYLTQNHFAGLVVDFEEIPEKSQKDFSQFIASLPRTCTPPTEADGLPARGGLGITTTPASASPPTP
jgi:spore germination protein YaaH